MGGLQDLSQIDLKKSKPEHRVSHKDLVAFRQPSVKAISVGWSVDGRRLAVGASDGAIILWTFSSGAPKRVWEPRMKGEVTRIQWSPTATDFFAASSLDKTVQIFDAKLGKTAATIDTGCENIYLTYTPPRSPTEGPLIAVLRKDDVIQFYNTKTLAMETELRPKTGYLDEVNEIRFTKEGDLLFITCGDGSLKVYTWPEQQKVHTFQSGTTPLFSIDFDPLGRYFAMGSGDALCSLWDAHDFLPIKTFSQLDWAIRSTSFSHDGEYICMASESDRPVIVHVASSKVVSALATGMRYVNSVVWHPTQHQVACIGAGSHVRLFAMEDEPT